jgi:hypothetical protein
LASGPGARRVAAWHWETQLAQSPDENIELPLRELARCGPPGLRLVVAELDSPRRHRSAAAERALAEHLRACEQLGRAEASDERLLLGLSLAEAIDRLGPVARLAAARLALRLLATSRPDEEAGGGELRLACEQVLRQIHRPPPSIPASELANDTRPLGTTLSKTRVPPTSLPGGGIPFAPADGLTLPIEEDAAPIQVSVTEHEPPASLVQPARLSPVSEPNPLRQSAAAAVNLPATSEAADVPDEPPTTALTSGTDLPATKALPVGQTPLEIELARRVTDPDAAVRERLAYLLPSLSGIDARPWLGWLSEDPSPQVRTAAFTVMATVPDPELFKRIAEAAQSDADPGVRSLARDLQQRRRR